MAKRENKSAFHLNVGIISFLLILIYIFGHLISLLNREEKTIYEVIQSRIHESIQVTGIILRDETIVKAEKGGYLNYYINENEEVAKNGLVYTCDETGQVHDYISNLLNQEESVSTKDYSSTQEAISRFEDTYTDSQFQNVYSLKYELEGLAMQMGDTVMANHMDEIEAKMGSDSFIKNYSSKSGLITYVEDGYEGKTFADLTEKDFDISNYKKKELKTSEKIQAGSSVYRLTKGTDWQIVVPLSKEEYHSIQDRERVTITISKDDLAVRCPISFEKKKDQYYGILSLSDYLVQYAKERYLKVEIEIESEDGLKIPNSAIVEKDCYKIPKAYFHGNSLTQKNLIIKKENSKGKVTFETKTVDIGLIQTEKDGEDEQTYYYVLAEEIPANTLICLENSQETMLLKETEKLPGVYSVNQGYADFRCIVISMKNDDYTIIEDNVTNSISLYDRIILNGNTVENNEIIY